MAGKNTLGDYSKYYDQMYLEDKEHTPNPLKGAYHFRKFVQVYEFHNLLLDPGDVVPEPP